MTNGKTFNDFVESVRVEDASYATLFGEGTNISQNLRRKFQEDAEYRAQIAKTMGFIRSYREGRVAPMRFREAMTTSDFPQLLGGIIDRSLLGGYRMFPTSYEMWCSINRDVSDFRTISRSFLNLGDGVLGTVAEKEEYPKAARAEGRYTYAVQKYGREFDFSWEAMVNDDLNAFSDNPVAFGRAAKRTTESFATSLITDANGPNAAFFNNGNGNLLAPGAASALSTTSLDAACDLFASMIDTGNEPVLNEPAVLVVPPSLKMTAMRLVKALQIRAQTGGGGTAAQQLDTVNLYSNLQIAVAPYIPRLITAGTIGRTAWFLAANPQEIERPAVELGFLRGHEEPQIVMKSPDAIRIGGGEADAFSGDFETDSVRVRVRHVVGGTLGDPRFMVGSFGQ